MKRICELITDDIFYIGLQRCKVLRIMNGTLYYTTALNGRYCKNNKRNQLRARSQQLVRVGEREHQIRKEY